MNVGETASPQSGIDQPLRWIIIDGLNYPVNMIVAVLLFTRPARWLRGR